MEKETMGKIIIEPNNLPCRAEDEPGFELWEKKIKEFALFPPVNTKEALASIQEASRLHVPLPFILTLCPAIENLDTPNQNGQTRKLVALDKNLPRTKQALQELISFMLFTKSTLNITPDIFLTFADSLERGAENMFENASAMPEIANASLKGVHELMFTIDQEHPGLLQKWNISLPKVRKQSALNSEANKIGPNRNALIEQREVEMLDPTHPLFKIWEKHLVLTRKDATFVATGWQNKKGAEALWNRVRFLLAEFMSDGEILPKIDQLLSQKKFTPGFPRPIFISSTTRQAGFEMEVDGFNTSRPTSVIAPLRNMGRWTEPEENSGWLNFLNENIIK